MIETRRAQIRLALREEGLFWNAYIARDDTMAGSFQIGSIIIGAAKQNPEIKATFMALMQQVLGDAVKQITGEAPDEWFTERAPESERSGHA